MHRRSTIASYDWSQGRIDKNNSADPERSRNRRITRHRTQLGIGLPVVAGPTHAVTAVFGYQFERFDGVPLVDRRLDLHRISFGLPLSLRLTQRWSLKGTPLFAYSGTMKQYDRRALLFVGYVGAAARLHADVSGRFGVVVLPLPRGYLPLPALGLDWRPAPTLRVHIRLPQTTEMQVLLGKRGEVFGGLYWQRSRAYLEESQSALYRNAIELSAGYRYPLPFDLAVEVRFGSLLRRTFDFASTPGTELSSSLGWIVGARLLRSIPAL
ncbi:MAG: hypothetical protein AAF355_00645 [Myxococcota bacterium]